MGISAEKVFGLEDLAKGDEVMFVATGISDGPLLKGIVVGCDDITTHSIVMRAKTGTIRHVEAKHRC
jgi:fructose-1,6-bisphosphatase II